MGELMTLDAWAAQTYGEAAPCIHTLRRWARDGRIAPAPVKHGRTYFVRSGAVYSPAYSGGDGRRLVDRIGNAPKTPKRA